MTMMIALVGGQPLPNLIPVRHYHQQGRLDAVLLVYTNVTESVYQRLKSTIERDTIQVYGVKTDAYQISDIITCLDSKLGELAVLSDALIFNLTGGTKAMVLAAYQVAQHHQALLLYLESEGRKSRAYHYTWNEHGLVAKDPPSEIIAPEITGRDFLDVHLGPGNWSEGGPSTDEGGAFEDAVAEALRSQVDEVMVGVKAMGQIDIDVLVRVGNQFGIIEAKMGQKGSRLDGIKQLSTAGRHLGTYTQQFYVISIKPTRSHQAIVEASRIKVISDPGYVTGERTLPDNDATTLVKEVKTALGGT